MRSFIANNQKVWPGGMVRTGAIQADFECMAVLRSQAAEVPSRVSRFQEAEKNSRQ